ncbi:MAG: NAD(P)-dependent oxidoreductase [Devosia sp.]
MRLLITGATGKVGTALIDQITAKPELGDVRIVALCHNRSTPPHPRIEVVHGSIADPEIIERAMKDVTHIVHLATVKESASSVIDVSIKGLFLLLEAARASRSLRQLILIGGDAAVGHCFVPYEAPVTELSPRRAYPGVYAFSKVLEEVMVEQYCVQYGLNGTILRAPWIMEKDDLKYALSFGDDQFGGPAWDTLIPREQQVRYASENCVPVLLDATGGPLRRNFIHLCDLVSAIMVALEASAAFGHLFNIAMTQPVDYAELGAMLAAERSMRPVQIATPFFSNALDNAKARLQLGWKPSFDLKAMVESAFAYKRAANDPRRVWYAG